MIILGHRCSSQMPSHSVRRNRRFPRVITQRVGHRSERDEGDEQKGAEHDAKIVLNEGTQIRVHGKSFDESGRNLTVPASCDRTVELVVKGSFMVGSGAMDRMTAQHEFARSLS